LSVYYNDNDPYCAAWLRNLITAELIAPGVVDDRDIRDVRPADLEGFVQCHFFAGIGGWPLALQLAGWPGARPVWTASCPCQPFSTAGSHRGHGDERHLWPALSSLIRERKPPIIFGEQVARAIGLGWLDAVAADLEEQAFAFGAAVLPACAISAPHERSRVWFVADTERSRLWNLEQRLPARRSDGICDEGEAVARDDGAEEPLADTDAGRCEGERLTQHAEQQRAQRDFTDGRGSSRRRQGSPLADTKERGQRAGLCASEPRELWRRRPSDGGRSDAAVASRSRLAFGKGSQGEWSHAAIAGSDWWAIEPCVGRVAHGVPARVGKLRALGNAIVPPLAAEFIRAVMA
jgi:DNA (cytosine-5)-methyltransferase 1